MGKPDYMKYDGRNVEPPYDTEAAPSSCTVGSIVGLKARVSEILHEALRGYDLSTRYRSEAGYVRWGLVEQDIHAAIDEANPGGLGTGGQQ